MGAGHWKEAPLSPRQTLGVFLALVVTVIAIFMAFVYPGLLTAPCSPNVWIPGANPLTTHGHWYCSEIVTLQFPGDCSNVTPMVNGSAIVTNFGGYVFSAHLFSYCVAFANLGLNASVDKPSGGIYNITVWPMFWEDWNNWTSPQNDTGFQWQPTIPFGSLTLLIAPH